MRLRGLSRNRMYMEFCYGGEVYYMDVKTKKILMRNIYESHLIKVELPSEIISDLVRQRNEYRSNLKIMA